MSKSKTNNANQLSSSQRKRILKEFILEYSDIFYESYVNEFKKRNGYKGLPSKKQFEDFIVSGKLNMQFNKRIYKFNTESELRKYLKSQIKVNETKEKTSLKEIETEEVSKMKDCMKREKMFLKEQKAKLKQERKEEKAKLKQERKEERKLKQVQKKDLKEVKKVEKEMKRVRIELGSKIECTKEYDEKLKDEINTRIRRYKDTGFNETLKILNEYFSLHSIKERKKRNEPILDKEMNYSLKALSAVHVPKIIESPKEFFSKEKIEFSENSRIMSLF